MNILLCFVVSNFIRFSIDALFESVTCGLTEFVVVSTQRDVRGNGERLEVTERV